MGSVSKRPNIAMIAALAGVAVPFAGCSAGGSTGATAIASTGAATIDGTAPTRLQWAALHDARKLANRHPDDVDLRSALGRAYLSVGLYGSAAATFKDAIAMGATEPYPARDLALARVALVRADGAVKQAWAEGRKETPLTAIALNH